MGKILAKLRESPYRACHRIGHKPCRNIKTRFYELLLQSGVPRGASLDRYAANPKNSLFLQFADSSHVGSTNPRDWVIYGHVYPVASGIVIQYWQRYAYNEFFASANHEGDWSSPPY